MCSQFNVIQNLRPKIFISIYQTILSVENEKNLQPPDTKSEASFSLNFSNLKKNTPEVTLLLFATITAHQRVSNVFLPYVIFI